MEVATGDVSFVRSLNLVREKAAEKIGYKFFYFSYFGRLPQSLFIITESNDCLYLCTR